MTSHNGASYPHDEDASGNREVEPICHWQENLALHALGSLSTAEVPGLIEHLASGCPVCVAEHSRVIEPFGLATRHCGSRA